MLLHRFHLLVRVFVSCVVSIALLPALAAGAPVDCGGKKVDVLLDQDNPGQSGGLKLRHGQSFVVGIDHANPDKFDYKISGIARPAERQVGPLAEEKKCVALPSVMHDRRFGGYLVAAIPKTATDSASQMFIFVETPEWQYEFGGAFVVSGFRDPVYGLEAVKNGEQTQQVLREDRGLRSKARLGFAANVSVYHERLDWLAATFGLGVQDENRTSYFVGPSLRLSDRLAVTAGPAWSSVKRLPAGAKVDQPVSDPNILANLKDRVIPSWFFSFSYTFLNPGGKQLFKPFADQATPGTSTPGAGTTKPPAAAAEGSKAEFASMGEFTAGTVEIKLKNAGINPDANVDLTGKGKLELIADTTTVFNGEVQFPIPRGNAPVNDITIKVAMTAEQAAQLKKAATKTVKLQRIL